MGRRAFGTRPPEQSSECYGGMPDRYRVQIIVRMGSSLLQQVMIRRRKSGMPRRDGNAQRFMDTQTWCFMPVTALMAKVLLRPVKTARRRSGMRRQHKPYKVIVITCLVSLMIKMVCT